MEDYLDWREYISPNKAPYQLHFSGLQNYHDDLVIVGFDGKTWKTKFNIALSHDNGISIAIGYMRNGICTSSSFVNIGL